MARIAFFADDETGVLCARMVSLGLSVLPGPTTLALPAGTVVKSGSTASRSAVATVALPPNANAFDVQQKLCPADRAGADFVAALPLESLRQLGVRDQFDAVITVGADAASASRALRAARYVAADGTGMSRLDRPAWFLAAPGQAELRTKVRLSANGNLALPFATRALPMALPRMTIADRRGLEDGEPSAAVLGTSLLLGALTLCVAADPQAKRFEPADVANLMAARTLPAERTLSDRLVVLANAYGQLEGEAYPAPPLRSAYGSPARRATSRQPEASAARRRAGGERNDGRLRRA